MCLKTSEGASSWGPEQGECRERARQGAQQHQGPGNTGTTGPWVGLQVTEDALRGAEQGRGMV